MKTTWTRMTFMDVVQKEPDVQNYAALKNAFSDRI